MVCRKTGLCPIVLVSIRQRIEMVQGTFQSVSFRSRTPIARDNAARSRRSARIACCASCKAASAPTSCSASAPAGTVRDSDTLRCLRVLCMTRHWMLLYEPLALRNRNRSHVCLVFCTRNRYFLHFLCKYLCGDSQLCKYRLRTDNTEIMRASASIC